MALGNKCFGTGRDCDLDRPLFAAPAQNWAGWALSGSPKDAQFGGYRSGDSNLLSDTAK
jgi:hypothetical protein